VVGWIAVRLIAFAVYINVMDRGKNITHIIVVGMAPTVIMLWSF
jgi:branched-subunit amino acid transport protein